jgi:hypothetical protein
VDATKTIADKVKRDGADFDREALSEKDTGPALGESLMMDKASHGFGAGHNVRLEAQG